ncbi:MAG: PepSY domain-containing protein [Bacteroidetes bacterium]|nr:PepSY domain-containing protein [Bacteroidota bacterium]
MKKSRVIRRFKKLHKWPAILIAFFAILFAASGIVMNHRQIFSPVDVSRKILPSGYTYENWNLAAVRGSVDLDDENSLIFGNIGIWQSNDDFKSFEDFNQGFPKGIDNKKIYSVIKFQNNLFAGTQLGLYKRAITNGEWEKVDVPVHEDRIADLGIKGDELLVLTRHYLLSSKNGHDFTQIQLPEPVGYERKAGMFNTLWELHSGELFGLPGKLAVDLLGLVTILLSVTGLLHFFFPKIIRRRKKKEKPVTGLVSTKKKNLRWHNVVGYVFLLFLIINTFSGMHLRPPLLIAIVNSKVDIIPNTHMDSPNPWFDKLRRVHWDDDSKKYIFSTSEGLFFAEETLTKKLIPAPSQPPVSIMGCNVFKSLGEQRYLVGSFSGMFLWNTKTGSVADFFSRQPYFAPQGMARPIASNMVAGWVEGKESDFWFDFNGGAIGLNGKEFPKMSEEIQLKSPMSLWNVSLELHTGRIFEHLVGMFYILYVPLAGICILLVLISGFFVWLLVYKKGKKAKE